MHQCTAIKLKNVLEKQFDGFHSALLILQSFLITCLVMLVRENQKNNTIIH
jgi:hypothetical protein